MKTLVLSYLFLLAVFHNLDAQIISQERYFELTDIDSAISSPIKLVFVEGSIFIASKSISIYSEIKRKRKRKDSSTDFWLKDKTKIRIYFDQSAKIKRVFIYAADRIFFINS